MFNLSCNVSGINYQGTKFDPHSIMLYYLPDNWITSCTAPNTPSPCASNPTSPNFTLSLTDISWLQQLYPKSTNNPPELTVKFVDNPPPPKWKVAWIKKIITETYGPLIGVKWNFDTTGILNESTSSQQGTYQNISGPITDQGTIVGIVIGVIALSILIILCGYYNKEIAARLRR